ncbi:MAG: ABC transporter ATP-binding protein [Gemmataceae bacterium]
MSEVALEHICRRFSAAPFAGLNDFSLQIHTGELLALVGPSGAGKSTLLRIIAGLEPADAGVVRIAGRDVTSLQPADRDVALIPQRPALYPHLSVLRNLSIGLEMRLSRRRPERLETIRIHQRVDEAIALLGLAPLLNRRPFQLSGGEQQRVALGRVLVRRASVWLLDEPFAHLDAARKIQLRRDLHLLRSTHPATMFYVTHDPDEASALGQRLAVLHAGRLEQLGEPLAVFDRPATRFVAEFLGAPGMNLADGTLVRSSSGTGQSLCFAAADGAFHLPVPAELATHGAEGRPVTAGIRADDLAPVALSPPPSDAAVSPGWTVQLVEPLPPRRLVTARRGRWNWSLWWPGDPPRLGDVIDLSLNANRLHWFDATSRLRLGR